MMDIKQFSKKELEDELKRRKNEEGRKPEQLQNPDLTDLREVTSNYIDSILNQTVDDDLEHYIFETAMEAIYGEDIFERVGLRRSLRWI